jgi:hypothetical protein
LKFAMKRGDVNYLNIFFNIISLPVDYWRRIWRDRDYWGIWYYNGKIWEK